MPTDGIEQHKKAPFIVIAGPISSEQRPTNDNHERHQPSHLRWLNKMLEPRRRLLRSSLRRDDQHNR